MAEIHKTSRVRKNSPEAKNNKQQRFGTQHAPTTILYDSIGLWPRSYKRLFFQLHFREKGTETWKRSFGQHSHTAGQGD